MKEKNNKQRLFEVMSKLDKTFKYDLNEVSIGLSQRAFDTTMRDKLSNSDSEIMRRKSSQQMDKFSQYINPELKKYVVEKFADVEGFEMYSTDGVQVVLLFPIIGKQSIDSVKILVRSDSYKVVKSVLDRNGGRPEEMEGGSEFLSQKHISILPTIIKRIQADIRGEKSLFNPAKPEIEPAKPEIEPAKPEIEPAKPSGFLNKFKSKFKE